MRCVLKFRAQFRWTILVLSLSARLGSPTTFLKSVWSRPPKHAWATPKKIEVVSRTCSMGIRRVLKCWCILSLLLLWSVFRFFVRLLYTQVSGAAGAAAAEEIARGAPTRHTNQN